MKLFFGGFTFTSSEEEKNIKTNLVECFDVLFFIPFCHFSHIYLFILTTMNDILYLQK